MLRHQRVLRPATTPSRRRQCLDGIVDNWSTFSSTRGGVLSGARQHDADRHQQVRSAGSFGWELRAPGIEIVSDFSRVGKGVGMTKHRAKALYRACSPSQAYQAWLGFFLNCALVLWCAAWLTLIAVDEAPAWPWLVALLPLGLFLADLFSGLVHWATDTWLDETQWRR